MAAADLAEYRALVKRVDRAERHGFERTRISTLLPLRDAARAVLHPTTSPERADR